MSIAIQEAREADASNRLGHFLSPRSLAVVGASESSFWARNAFRNLSVLGFSGVAVPVNPNRKTVFGRACIANLRQLERPVDLAFVAVPTQAVPGVLADAAAAGIRNAVIVAAGFGEIGAGGRGVQAALAEQVARLDLTVLGPNCPGFLNMAAGVAAYGQEIPAGLPRGGVGVVLQSGALASAVLKFAHAFGIGLSAVVCMGNEVAVSAADVLEHFIADDETRVVAMFLEQIRDGARFLGLARRAMAAGKPIVLLKVGRTAEGQKAALAHTGAVAGDEAVVDAALRQVGVVRVRSLEELLMTAGLLSQVPPLKGPRLAVVTTSGGACDIIADRASDEGLELPDYSPGTAAELRAYLPDIATVQNPLDGASVDMVRQTGTAAAPLDVVVDVIRKDPSFDFVLYMGFNMVPLAEPVAEQRDDIAARIDHVGDLIRNSERPILCMSQTCLQVGAFARDLYARNGMFMLGGIEFGLSAIGNAVRWQRTRAAMPTNDAGEGAWPAVAAFEPVSGAWSEDRGRRFLEKANVPVVPAVLAQTPRDALRATERFGFPVALKICSAGIPHKSDIGGVALNLRDEKELGAAFAAVRSAGDAAAGAQIEGVLVSPMRGRGIELFAGITVDPTFGPTLAVGLGGIWIEIFHDVALRVLPVTKDEIAGMLRSLRASALLDGVRGGPRASIPAAAEAIWRISQAALSLGPTLRALEVNPLWCCGDQVEALDVLVVTGSEHRGAL